MRLNKVERKDGFQLYYDHHNHDDNALGTIRPTFYVYLPSQVLQHAALNI